MPRKQLRWILLGLLLLVVGAGAYAYRLNHRYKHWAIHDPGLVYRSAWLEPDVFAELIETHQIRTLINLCDPGEMGEDRWIGERQAVRGAGAQLLEYTMPRTVTADDPVIDKYVEVLQNPDNYPILVHCQHGVTRTAKLLSIYDILFRGMSAQQSVERMPRFGRSDSSNYNVAVKAFAASVEEHHAKKSQELAKKLDVLRDTIRKFQ